MLDRKVPAILDPFPIPFSVNALVKRLGTSKPTVASKIRQMQKLALVTARGKKIEHRARRPSRTLLLITPPALMAMVLAPIYALVLGPPTLNTEQGAEKVWLKPGATHYDSISMEITSDIFDRLPRGLSGFGGFTLVAETQGKPPFIDHQVHDAKASKISSGFISKCTLNIYYKISAENNSPQGVFTYDVVYSLQNGLLTIPHKYAVEVSSEKPAWLVESEKGIASFSFLAGTITEAVLLVGLPGFFLIRKLRKPLYQRGKVGWRRAILGVAIIIFTTYLVLDSIRYLPTTPNPFEYLVTLMIFAVGFGLTSIVILKR